MNNLTFDNSWADSGSHPQDGIGTYDDDFALLCKEQEEREAKEREVLEEQAIAEAAELQKKKQIMEMAEKHKATSKVAAPSQVLLFDDSWMDEIGVHPKDGFGAYQDDDMVLEKERVEMEEKEMKVKVKMKRNQQPKPKPTSTHQGRKNLLDIPQAILRSYLGSMLQLPMLGQLFCVNKAFKDIVEVTLENFKGPFVVDSIAIGLALWKRTRLVRKPNALLDGVSHIQLRPGTQFLPEKTLSTLHSNYISMDEPVREIRLPSKVLITGDPDGTTVLVGKVIYIDNSTSTSSGKSNACTTVETVETVETIETSGGLKDVSITNPSGVGLSIVGFVEILMDNVHVLCCKGTGVQCTNIYNSRAGHQVTKFNARNCSFSNNHETGLSISGISKCILENCQIQNNKRNGIMIRNGGLVILNGNETGLTTPFHGNQKFINARGQDNLTRKRTKIHLWSDIDVRELKSVEKKRFALFRDWVQEQSDCDGTIYFGTTSATSLKG